jgi:hypothetical protein
LAAGCLLLIVGLQAVGEGPQPGPAAPQSLGAVSANPQPAVATNQAPQPATMPDQPAASKLQVGNLGDVHMIQFEGAQHFSAVQLRSALECDLRYQAAARPSAELPGLVSTIQERLIEGYRNSGCPNAKVLARFDEATRAIRVQIEEGPRYRKGDVDIVGSPLVDQLALKKLLTSVPKERPWQIECDGENLTSLSDNTAVAWKAGENVRFGERSVAAVKAAVRRGLVEQGFASAVFDVKIVPRPDSDAANLVVQIQDGVSPARIQGIEIVGLKRNTREELLQFVGAAVGDPLNAVLLDRVHSQLKQCCRFWTYRVSAVLASKKADDTSLTAPVGTLLKIELDEYAEVPPLGKPLPEIDEVFRRAGLLLSSLETQQGSADFVVEASGLQSLTGGLKAVRAVIAADGRATFEVLSASESAWNLDHALLVTRNSYEVYDWRSKIGFAAPQPSSMVLDLKVKTSRDEQGGYEVAATCGTSMCNAEKEDFKANGPWRVHVEPVALLHLAHADEEKRPRISIRNGELKYSHGYFKMRLDAATGRLIEIKIPNSIWGSSNLLVARLEAGALEKTVSTLRRDGKDFKNMYDENHKFGSAFQFAMALVEKQPVVSKTPQLAANCRLLRQLQANPELGRLWGQWMDSLGIDPAAGSANPSAARTSFAIPIPPTIKASEISEADQYLAFAPLLADLMFPRGSWPWTLAREVCFLRFSEGVADASPEQNTAMWGLEFARLGGQDVGPIGALVLAKSYALLEAKDSPYAGALAVWAMSTLSREAFLKDARLATEGDTGLAVICRAVAEEFAKLSPADQSQILEGLPDNVQQAMKSFAKRRADQPSEPVGVALQHALLQTWDTGLKDLVQAEFRQMTDEIAKSPREGSTTK